MTDVFNLTSLPWSRLSAREQHVWAAAYVHAGGEAGAAVRQADAAVLELRALALDGPQGQDPEYDAARAGFYMELEEFAPWFRVAWKIRHGNGRAYREPSDAEVAEAYVRFQACRSDFS